MKRNWPPTSDRGAALPLVILMMVLLALTLSATAVLTQSAATTVRGQAVESTKRAALVTGALERSLRDLTPPTGRLLGIDPLVDPAGSCIGQLGPYAVALGSGTDPRTVNVDCVQATDSGLGFAQSSLMLVGDGSDCGTNCVTGKDGGLLVNSNSALTFQGIFINLAGAWDVKKVALSPDTSATTSVLQPLTGVDCPAAVGNFTSSPNCDCPSGMSADKCFQRSVALLKADINRFVARTGSTIASSQPGDTVTIPGCADRAQLSGSSLWALRLGSGTVNTAKLTELNLLFSGVTCPLLDNKNKTETVRIGDGATAQTPMLIISGPLRFNDPTAGSPMAPNTAAGAGNTWTINSDSALVVLGAPVLNAAKTAVIDCDPTQAGGMLQFAGSTYLRLDAGRMFLCPPAPRGVVLAAPNAGASAGFTWQGLSNQPLLATTFGRSGGEVLRANGAVFAPAAFFDINSQDKETQVRLSGGSVMRALTLAANPSTGALSKGSFSAPAPSANGKREVQLRFWDATRGRDLGIVQVVINDAYLASNPAMGYAFKVWRTMW